MRSIIQRGIDGGSAIVRFLTVVRGSIFGPQVLIFPLDASMCRYGDRLINLASSSCCCSEAILSSASSLSPASDLRYSAPPEQEQLGAPGLQGA